MIRVLLVDDEYLIRQSIKNSINWGLLGMEIVEEAEDGNQALEFIEKAKPDIVIMDINIPFINGIKVSKVIREFHPNIRIIILTGYDEFKYAKEAVNMGLFNYILKPIDSEEVEKVLQAAKTDIIDERKKNLHIKNIEYNNFMIEKKQFVNMLICNNNQDFHEEIEGKLKNYKLELMSTDLVVFIISINNLKEKVKVQSELENITQCIKNIILQKNSSFLNAIMFVDPDNNIVAILNSPDFSMGKNFITIDKEWKNITDIVKLRYNYSLTVAVSKCHNGYDLIPLCYKEAVVAMNKKFIYGSSRILHFQYENSFKNTDYHIFYDRESILYDLRIYNFESVNKKIYEIFNKLYNEIASKEFVIYISMDLISIMIDFISENNVEISNIIDNNDEFVKSLKNKEEINQVQNEIIEFYNKCINYIYINHRSRTAEVVKSAKEYIETNYYNGDLSLEEISLKIFVNPSYLCKVFKKELGISIVEYLTNIRLKSAKEIIDKDKTMKLADISERVGYNDQYYFSKCFKKHFGVTPIKYLQSRNN